MFGESIQSHRRIIWAFSGNVDITELPGMNTFSCMGGMARELRMEYAGAIYPVR
jgi:hypothetical protein